MIYLIYKLSLICHSICSIILCGFLLLITIILAPTNRYIEKYSAYECGFKSFELLQIPFDIHFYKIGILFLIFDVEILFLLPLVYNFFNYSDIGHASIIYFFILILGGLIYEFLTHIIKLY